MIASNYVKKIFNFEDDTLKIYGRLWQYETWLRRMVYVELRAKRGDNWSQGLRPVQDAKKTDKDLIHMGTSEQNDLSFAQLWQLLELIDSNWNCFANYFPPKKIWKAKNQEISQIRHRVAHFRTCHSDDLQRVEQFLRDIDEGFWLFCTSYNDSQPALPPSSDKVTEHFLHLDPLPWGELESKKWARVGHVNKSMVVGIIINKTYRPWSEEAQKASGQLYDVSLLSLDRKFDLSNFLENTRSIHQHLVTIDFDSLSSQIRLVIPAVLGVEKIIQIIADAERWARNCVNRSLVDKKMTELASNWPEFVLGPHDPMTFLAPDMKCSFFNV